MKKSISILLSALLVGSLSLAGCGRANPATPVPTAAAKPVTVRVGWWGNQVRNDRTQKVMDMYTAKHPNVKFEGEFVNISGYWDKLATQIAANSVTDVIQVDYNHIASYISKNLFENLTPYTKSGVLNIKDFSDTASGSVNGNLYGLSLGTNTQCIMYDPAMFAKAGVKEPTVDWTWQDYEDAITKIYTTTNVQAEPMLYRDVGTYIEYAARQTGATLFNKDDTGLGFTDEKIVSDIFERALRLTKAGVYPKPEVVVSISAVEDGLTVKGLACISASWSNQFIANVAAAKRPLKIAMLPKGGTKPGAYLNPSQFFCVSSNSKVKDDSVKFIDYFANDIEANKVLLAERGVPVSSVVREGIKSGVDKDTATTFDFIALVEKNSGPVDHPQPTIGAEVMTLAKTIYDEVVFEKTAPKEAASKFMKQANDIIAKAKK